MTTFIIKKPPVEESSITSASAPSKKGKQAKAGSTNTNGDVSPEVGNGDNSNLPPVSTTFLQLACLDPAVFNCIIQYFRKYSSMLFATDDQTSLLVV